MKYWTAYIAWQISIIGIAWILGKFLFGTLK